MKEEGVVKGAKALEPEPPLHYSDVWVWNAFNVLSAARQNGESGPQPIAVSEMYAYANMLEVPWYDREYMVVLVSHLDHIWLTEKYKKIASAQKQQAAKSRANRRG